MLNLHKAIVTSLGAGYAPFAPGTAGAAVGVFVIVLLNQISALQNEPTSMFYTLLGLTIFFCVLGAYSTDQLEHLWGKDPSRVVIDETIGVWIGMFGLPITWQWLLAAFVLFRFFDIAKPLGIRKLEAIPGGWGVMLDDVLAGIYTLIVLQVAYHYL
ncbi:MAG: phosphatidylglycerophosphatase A [Saprospiraceae bacterium]